MLAETIGLSLMVQWPHHTRLPFGSSSIAKGPSMQRLLSGAWTEPLLARHRSRLDSIATSVVEVCVDDLITLRQRLIKGR
jgi:hypothetical protein